MRLIFFILILFIPFLNLWGQTPSTDPHWELVWSDSFDGDIIDASKWTVMDNFDHYGGERQVFIIDNVYQSNGNLVIEIKEETYSCPAWALDPATALYHCKRQYDTGQPYDYTSGWVQSKQAYNTQYGYIEAEIYFDYGIGLWPAFWTFVGDGVLNATNDSEIDIAELTGESGINNFGTNIHRSQSDPDIYGEMIAPPNYSWSSWHKYAIEWSPTKIIWYLDDIQVRTMHNHGIVDPVLLIFGIGLRPTINLSQMNFPYKKYVNFVKVWKPKIQCDLSLNLCNYSFSSYTNATVKDKIIIGDNSCKNTILNGENIYLRASDEIIINGDFSIQLGAELFLDVQPCY